VFRGDDGLDELTTTTTSSVWRVHGGEVREATLDPRAHGVSVGTAADLRGGDAAHNADVVRRVLDGERGPVRDAVVLNAAAALAVHDDPALDVDDALSAALVRAAGAIDSGAARATLDRWIAVSA
jgi:anthranilate phosphoribosyltransferase